MAFLAGLSIDRKIYIIPVLAVVSFGVYLAITASMALRNADMLQTARDQDFPILRLSDRVLFGLERINEDLQGAATTANPLPCSPALAASMAALSASKLVCSAMLRITSRTLPTLLLSLSN